MNTAAIPASANTAPPPSVALPVASSRAGQDTTRATANDGAHAGVPGDRATTGATAPAPAPKSSASSSTTLTPQALALIDRLKTRDTEVRQHEQAHLAAAGGMAVSGASYTYQRGPNGVDYAIGGEVHIDTSPGRTPEETITRARTIQAAALAPADPSGPDRAVAAQAQQMEQQARAELAVETAQQAGGGGAPSPGAQVAPLQQPPTAESVRRAYEMTPLAAPRLDIVA